MGPLDLADVRMVPWGLSGPVERYGLGDMALVLGEDGPRCTPYAVEVLQVGLAVREGQAVQVRLFRCASSEEAFGVYSALRIAGPPGRAVPVGASANARDSGILAWKGRYCFDLRQVEDAPASPEALRALAEALAAHVTEASVLPALVRALPGENLIPGRRLLFRSVETLEPALTLPWLDVLALGRYGQGAPAVDGAYAHYIFTAHDAHVIVLAYDSEERAAGVEEAFMEFHRREADTYRKTALYREAKQPTGAWALAARQGRLVVLVPPTKAAGAARKVIGEVLRNCAGWM